MDLENAEPAATAARPQRWHPATMWFVLYSAASGAIEGMAANRPESGTLFLAMQIAVSGFLIFWWASDDAKRGGRPLSRLAPLWIVLFGALWILARLFASRRPPEAWRGLGRGALVALAAVGLYTAFFALFVPDVRG